MSRSRSGQIGRGKDFFQRADVHGLHLSGAPGSLRFAFFDHWCCCERRPCEKAVLADFCRLGLGKGIFAALVALVLLFGVEVSHAEMSDTERAVYARGVEYCRGDVPRPMALSPDKNVLCFDGTIPRDQDVALIERFGENGLFVIRSFGGDRFGAVRLAEAIRERHATVVVYDYCMSSCASYLLVASATAFVIKNTLVAWDFVANPYECPVWKEAKDGGPPRLERSMCPDAPPEHQSVYKYYGDMDEWFYWTRTVDPKFEFPPESNIVRRILKSRFQGTGTYPDHLLWTWNPRYYASAITTRITYEAYPQSQDEVDAMASRLLSFRVTYDP